MNSTYLIFNIKIKQINKVVKVKEEPVNVPDHIPNINFDKQRKVGRS